MTDTALSAVTTVAVDTASGRAAERRRWIALYLLCAGMLMIVLDVTVVNVALPAIHSDLGFSGSSLAWVVNAYLISFGGLLLLAGRVGDLLGHRRIFLAGLGVFTGSSMVCGLAGSQQVLVLEACGAAARGGAPAVEPECRAAVSCRPCAEVG